MPHLSVQAVARRLGVSKGGAYHHFADRRALLSAALDLWRERYVDALNVEFRAIADPRRRLRAVLEFALVHKAPTVILQLMAASEDPAVAAALEAATRARLALLTDTFAELGATRADASDRALILYGHYLGLAQLQRGRAVPKDSPARTRAHLRRLEALLLTGLPQAAAQAAGTGSGAASPRSAKA